MNFCVTSTLCPSKAAKFLPSTYKPLLEVQTEQILRPELKKVLNERK
jgi:hypothetical protein